MNKGMEMMLKAIGVDIDPEEIKGNFERAAKAAQDEIANINAKLDALNSKLDLVLSHQVLLYEQMVRAGLIQLPENVEHARIQ